MTEDSTLETPVKLEKLPTEEEEEEKVPMDSTPVTDVLSEKRKALFEPLEPANRKRPSAELLLPPPDFDSAIYPKGWLIGKKRKLVNVDVVESMRRIAVQEMNRKVISVYRLQLWVFNKLLQVLTIIQLICRTEKLTD